MTLIDQIEKLGAAVDAGQISREDAIEQLQQISDGGLTRVGAADLLKKWRTCRARYADDTARAWRRPTNERW